MASRILLNDGSSTILLNDGSSKLLLNIGDVMTSVIHFMFRMRRK
jgi:hypothetical protein